MDMKRLIGSATVTGGSAQNRYWTRSKPSVAISYRTTCFAAAACFFFSASALALTCFCAACLCADFGDLSPIITLPLIDGLLPGLV